MSVPVRAVASRANFEKIIHEPIMPKLTVALLLAAMLLPTAFAQRMYDGSGRQLGRVDAERFYSASGQPIGRVDGERIYEA